MLRICVRSEKLLCDNLLCSFITVTLLISGFLLPSIASRAEPLVAESKASWGVGGILESHGSCIQPFRLLLNCILGWASHTAKVIDHLPWTGHSTSTLDFRLWTANMREVLGQHGKLLIGKQTKD